MSAKWAAMDIQGLLQGSVCNGDYTYGERLAWMCLILVAKESRVEGVVCLAPGIPWPREALASHMFVDVETLNSMIEKRSHDKNHDDNHTSIEIDKTGCLVLTNFWMYQFKAHKGVSGKDDSRCPICHKVESECGHERGIYGKDIS